MTAPLLGHHSTRPENRLSSLPNSRARSQASETSHRRDHAAPLGSCGMVRGSLSLSWRDLRFIRRFLRRPELPAVTPTTRLKRWVNCPEVHPGEHTDFREVPSDVVGRIFQKLIGLDERHRYIPTKHSLQLSDRQCEETALQRQLLLALSQILRCRGHDCAASFLLSI